MSYGQNPKGQADPRVIGWAITIFCVAGLAVFLALVVASQGKAKEGRELEATKKRFSEAKAKMDADQGIAEAQAKRDAEAPKEAMIRAVTQWGDKAAPESKAGLAVDWDWFPSVSGVETGTGATIWRYVATYKATILGTRVKRAVKILYRCQGYDPNTCSQTSIEDLAAP